MAKAKKNNSTDLITQALEAFKRQSIHEAVDLCLKARDQNPDDARVLLTLGRCQLSARKNREAQKTYQSLLKKPAIPAAARIEAKIALHDFAAALADAEAALQQPHDSLVPFFMAIICYHQGFVAHCFHYFMKSIELHMEWDEDDPSNALLHSILPLPEFQDLEQIYVDALERATQESDWLVNRWLSLEMPLTDMMFAKTPEKTKQSVKQLLNLLAPQSADSLLEQGKEKLEQIIRDFTRSEADAQFGFKALNAYNEDKLANVAQLVLALELEHLKQFAAFVGFTAELVEASQFQNLITLMPYHIALDFLILYTLSDIEKPDIEKPRQQIDSQHMAALIVTCFVNFYQKMDQYRHNQKPAPIHEED